MKKSLKLFALMAALVCVIGTASMAAVTSVIIYTNNTSRDSTSIYCSSLIDGFGVNDASSTKGLYYTLRFESTLGSTEAYSRLMQPGTGSMGPSEVSSWSTLFTGKTVPSGNGNYFIRLNPQGALANGCYGAGKLVD